MNLFALTRDAARRIARLPLSQDVQTAVEAMFRHQEREFDSYVQEEIAFDGKYRPDEGECLKIDSFQDGEIEAAIKAPLSVSEIRADTADFDNIKAIFSGYEKSGKAKVLIQSFDKRKVLSSKGLSIFHSGNVYKRIEGVGLTLDNRLSVVIADQTLKFFSFHLARQIFDLEVYYREATDDDLKDFATSDKLKVADVGNLVSASDRLIRKKVSLVMQSGILDHLDVVETKKIAAVFDIDLKVEKVGQKTLIVLPEDKKELKKVLRFLDEDYYQSALLKKSYLSNSKRAV